MSGLSAATGLVGEATDSLGLTGEGGIFGDAPQVRNVTPREINLPGLRFSRSGSTFNIERGGEVTPLLRQIRRSRMGQAEMLRGQAEEFGPAINRLTEARLEALGAERRRTLGTLREQLSRRRVLGSSFGSDALARAGAEFGMRAAEAEAESELQQLQVETDLLNRAVEAEVQAITPELERLGFESQLGAQIVSTVSGANQEVQMANAQLAQAHAQGQGEFFGSIIGAGAAILGG